MSYELDEIVSIEEVYNTSSRYDITVEHNHNFYANGILVHNCENLVVEVFTDNKYSKFEVTLKLDGSSCSVYYKDGVLGVCSRNLELKMTEENVGNSFIATATKTGLLSALEKLGRNIMVQSELMGPQVQGNKENLKEHNLYVFDIFNIDDSSYLAPKERLAIFEELKVHGFTGGHAPVLASNVTLAELGIVDVASSKVYVDRPSINSKVAEGAVFKRMDGQFSFKSINNRFLLKYTEE